MDREVTQPRYSGLESPLVSVATITYNHERFIAKTIESVLAQQTDFDVEMVIGEDASNDGAPAIVDAYERAHPGRLRVLRRQRNIGMRANFVDVMLACRGRYIALLDGDDYWTSPDKLQRQVDLLEANPGMSFCFHAADVIYDGSELGAAPAYPPGRASRYGLADLAAGVNMKASSIVLRRAGLSFPAWYHAVPIHDWPLAIMKAREGEIGYIDQRWSVHRVHGGSASLLAMTRDPDGEIERMEDSLQALRIVAANLLPREREAFVAELLARHCRMIRRQIQLGDHAGACASVVSYYLRNPVRGIGQAWAPVSSFARTSARRFLGPRPGSGGQGAIPSAPPA